MYTHVIKYIRTHTYTQIYIYKILTCDFNYGISIMKVFLNPYFYKTSENVATLCTQKHCNGVLMFYLSKTVP